jgi:Mg2+ and Co2+ transporter CorA
MRKPVRAAGEVILHLSKLDSDLSPAAAIVIPLTFIAGIHGTNFDCLPEAKYGHSYSIFWRVMISVASGMFVQASRMVLAS